MDVKDVFHLWAYIIHAKATGKNETQTLFLESLAMEALLVKPRIADAVLEKYWKCLRQ